MANRHRKGGGRAHLSDEGEKVPLGAGNADVAHEANKKKAGGRITGRAAGGRLDRKRGGFVSGAKDAGHVHGGVRAARTATGADKSPMSSAHQEVFDGLPKK